MPQGQTPHPLPNLEYRTIAASSLSDFVAGVEVQNTRDAVALDLEQLDPAELLDLRDRYFATNEPNAKAELRERIANAEDAFLSGVFDTALARARNDGDEAVVAVERLISRFRGVDRVFPALMPAFHTPDVAARGGWDIVIMNPPYLSRKEARQRLEPAALRDLEAHYGRTYDLMIHFARRGLELVCAGGVLSMIFNDSIFTSTDAAELRIGLLGGEDVEESVHVAARTRCFEGVGVTGGVIVASKGLGHDPEIRWVENHGRPTNDLLAAGRIADPARSPTPIGQSELFEVDAKHYNQLPHRPLFRPSLPAREVLKCFRRCRGWKEFSRYSAPPGQASWELLSNTRALNGWIAEQKAAGWYDVLEPGKDFVLLGLVVEGGQGLATADDRRFLGAIEGTADAEAAVAMRDRLEELTLEHHHAATQYHALRGERDQVEALLAVADDWNPVKDLGWPKSGLIRTVSREQLRASELSEAEIRKGIAAGPVWVPFEKGDSSGTARGGTRWTRENPIAIDWSTASVALLRKRAANAQSYRKPYFRNEHLWGRGGLAWNAIASYLTVRVIPAGAINGHGAPVIRPDVSWLSISALAALLNSAPLDFILRTLLASRQNTLVGGLRRLPVPVLSLSERDELGDLASRAGEATREGEFERAEEIRADVSALVGTLYGISDSSSLWVTR